MASSAVSPATASAWLYKSLTDLLSSPHITFPKPPPELNIHFGHGPVDLFSTRFINLFTNDAVGVLLDPGANILQVGETEGGKKLDRGKLKEVLLILQKTWNPETVKADGGAGGAGAQGGQQEVLSLADDQVVTTVTGFSWENKLKASDEVSIKALATVKEAGGAPRIKVLALQGDPALFTKAAETS